MEDGLILVRASDVQMKAHGHDEERWGGWEFDGCFLDFDDLGREGHVASLCL